MKKPACIKIFFGIFKAYGKTRQRFQTERAGLQALNTLSDIDKKAALRYWETDIILHKNILVEKIWMVCYNQK